MPDCDYIYSGNLPAGCDGYFPQSVDFPVHLCYTGKWRKSIRR
jgi:hypothetical protein